MRLPSVPSAEHRDLLARILWQAIRDSVYYTSGPGVLKLQPNSGDSTALAHQKRGYRKDWQAALANYKQSHPDEYASFLIELEEHGWAILMQFEAIEGVT